MTESLWLFPHNEARESRTAPWNPEDEVTESEKMLIEMRTVTRGKPHIRQNDY